MTKTVAMDIETDALDATHIWVICAEELETGHREQFLNVTTVPEERDRFIAYCSTIDTFVFHNGIGFDVPVLNRLLDTQVIDPSRVLDTLIMSRLVDYSMDGKGHSLKAWGRRLGDLKIGFEDFSTLTQEMIDYCVQDVVVTIQIYNKLRKVIEDPQWQDAIRCEHDIQIICEEMTANGFYFNHTKARTLLTDIESRMQELEEGFQKDFPPKLEEVNRIKYKRKADGTVYSSVTKAQEKYEQTRVDWSSNPPEVVCYEFIPFNPASPKQRIERLWEAGWEPFEKTKGHIDYERENKRRAWS